MIAAGLYDGSVVVYNLQSAGSEPVCQATADSGKHRDVVWEVKWTRDDLESYLNFFSVSEVRQSSITVVMTQDDLRTVE